MVHIGGQGRKGMTKSSVETTVVWMTKNCSQTLFYSTIIISIDAGQN